MTTIVGLHIVDKGEESIILASDLLSIESESKRIAYREKIIRSHDDNFVFATAGRYEPQLYATFKNRITKEHILGRPSFLNYDDLEKYIIEYYLNWFFPRSGQNHHFMSWYISGAQRLPNGNTLITEGDNGRVFEVSYDSKDIVWEYISPSRAHDIYRAYRIPPEWVPGNPAGYPFWEDI